MTWLAQTGFGSRSIADCIKVVRCHAPVRRSAEEVWTALRSIVETTTLGLTPAQTFNTIGSYAATGGVGARPYDRLIRQVAIQHGIARIITSNVRHMRGLFPALDMVDPGEVSA